MLMLTSILTHFLVDVMNYFLCTFNIQESRSMTTNESQAHSLLCVYCGISSAEPDDAFNSSQSSSLSPDREMMDMYC